jgi:hypothetical protein
MVASLQVPGVVAAEILDVAELILELHKGRTGLCSLVQLLVLVAAISKYDTVHGISFLENQRFYVGFYHIALEIKLGKPLAFCSTKRRNTFYLTGNDRLATRRKSRR